MQRSRHGAQYTHAFAEPSGDEAKVREIAERWFASGKNDCPAGSWLDDILGAVREAYAAGARAERESLSLVIEMLKYELRTIAAERDGAIARRGSEGK